MHPTEEKKKLIKPDELFIYLAKSKFSSNRSTDDKRVYVSVHARISFTGEKYAYLKSPSGWIIYQVWSNKILLHL